MRVILIMALVATLTAISGQPTGARVIPNTPTIDDLFLLEGYTSGAWAEIDAGEYNVMPSGYVVKRSADADGNSIDWSVEDYSAYRWSGFIFRGDDVVPVLNESLEFVETEPANPIDVDGALDLNAAYNVIADELHAGQILTANADGIRTTRAYATENGDVTEYAELGGALRLGHGKQTRRPHTLANVDNGGGGAEWTDPQNAARHDAVYASTLTTGSDAGEYSQTLRATDFRFRLPRGAIVTAVELVMYGYNDPNSAVLSYTVALTYGGDTKDFTFDTFPPDNLAITVDGLDTYGLTLGAAQVNDSAFGVDIYAGNYFPVAAFNYINSIALTVHYYVVRDTVLLDAGRNHFDNVGAVNLYPITTPSNNAQSTDANLYVKGGKLIVQYNDGGTVRYKYLDLTGTGVTWTHSTSAP